ncbi:23S rRNA (guanosine(2251)-2'-O)-methyltransferase RlmB [bacterium]|nr:23S rRNA (guanosine(2251)-2'-O)-methyltransferase RlmB [bacterium]
MKEVVCGKNAVLEILKSGNREVDQVFISSSMRDKALDVIKSECQKKKINFSMVTREEILNLSKVEKNQGVAVKVSAFKYTRLENIVEEALKDPRGAFLVILDGILDPQNLGALVRTSYQCGAHGLIIPKDNAAPIGPASTRAAAGATEYLPIAQVTNISNTINYLKEKEIWVVGADMDTDVDLYSFDFTGSYALVLGSEGKGLRRLVKDRCDIIIKIPMEGKIDSFNVSVAGAIFLSHMHRQRRIK